MADTPFTLQGSLAYPPDEGEPDATLPFLFQGVFKNEIKFIYNVTGSGSVTVSFGTLTTLGAKVLVIEVDPDSSPAVAPVYVRINGGDALGKWEIAPGGFIAYGNPKPTTGLLSMVIEYTTTNKIRVRILG
jgi:hypothetical protein